MLAGHAIGAGSRSSCSVFTGSAGDTAGLGRNPLVFAENALDTRSGPLRVVCLPHFTHNASCLVSETLVLACCADLARRKVSSESIGELAKCANSAGNSPSCALVLAIGTADT